MKTTVYIGASLDGFIARKDGNFDWLSQFANEEAFESYNEFMGRIDAMVIGRGTFETVLAFPTWPYTLRNMNIAGWAGIQPQANLSGLKRPER